MTADLVVRLRPPALPKAAGCLGGTALLAGGGWSPAAGCGGDSSPLLGHFANDEMPLVSPATRAP